MSGIGAVYGEALYGLALEEGVSEVILQQLTALDESFAEEPGFLRLLSAPNLSKGERCRILDDCLRGKADAYVLNLLKVLTEKGYIRHFPHCVKAYREYYEQDHGILAVTAVTAVPMTDRQKKALTGKLHKITGRQITLVNRPDPGVLGGIRLDYGGKRMDGTVAHRMEAIGNRLQNSGKAGTVWN